MLPLSRKPVCRPRLFALLAAATLTATTGAVLAQAPTDADADLGYKAYRELGERFEANAMYPEAAREFERAYLAKPKREELAFHAAELYSLVKDYARAERLYAVVAEDVDDYPLAGLKRARCLKQSGRYEDAVREYLDYLARYDRDDRAVVADIVELEVQGVNLARQEGGQPSGEFVVRQLNAGVNGPHDELAPMPLAETALYYLSDRLAGKTRVYRSDLEGGLWGEARLAEQFPVVRGKHVGAGTLGPAGDRFYFALCDERADMGQPAAPCALYVTVRRESGEWTSPQALPSYINSPDATTTTQPFAYREGEREVLLFASDRLDGHGGLDLYRAERPLDSDATDFSFPRNLGPVVNSVADEVTPYYDDATKTLYFSSNGYLNYGGFDVFRARGDAVGFGKPENLRSPVNGPADDYYWRGAPDGRGGFFASNRAVDGAKSRTSHEDLFRAEPGVPLMPITLAVVDSATGRPLGEVALAVYVHPAGGGARRLAASELSEDGYFALELPMGADIELDAQRLDYRRAQERFRLPERQREGFQLPRLRMARIALPLTDVQRIEDARTDAPVATLPSQVGPAPAEPTSSRAPAPASTSAPPRRVESPSPTLSPTSSTSSSTPSAASTPSQPTPARTSSTASPSRVETSPPPTGMVRRPLNTYRIQIEARVGAEAAHTRYDRVRGVGSVSTVPVPGKSLQRVLVGDYDSYEAARAELAAVRAAGYGDAYVVRFESGEYRGAAR